MVLSLVLGLVLAYQCDKAVKDKPADALTTYATYEKYRDLLTKIEQIDDYPEAYFEQDYFKVMEKDVEDLRKRHTQVEVDALGKKIAGEFEHLEQVEQRNQDERII